MKNSISHDGHRERFRQRIENVGLKNLPKHEVLEFLLNFCIPRKDTNPIAHALIKEFGSVSAVLDADVTRLSKVEGVGERTAQFLTSLPKVLEIYKAEKNKRSNITKLPGVAQAIEFFRNNYEIGTFEKCVVLCLNTNYKLVKVVEFDGKTDNSVKFDLREFARKINDNNINGIIMMHTHPEGSVKPSVSDYVTTKEIVQMCHSLRILMCDHLILNEKENFSFLMNGLIDKIYDELGFSSETEKSNMLKQIVPFLRNLK